MLGCRQGARSHLKSAGSTERHLACFCLARPVYLAGAVVWSEPRKLMVFPRSSQPKQLELAVGLHFVIADSFVSLSATARCG